MADSLTTFFIVFTAISYIQYGSTNPIGEKKFSENYRDARFLNFNNPNELIAAASILAPGVLVAHNVLSGNDKIQIRPNIKGFYNPDTGSVSPGIGLGVQVGEGHIAPTINVGGQLNADSGSIAPIVGTGVNIGHGDGINPEVGSNIVFQNDEIEYQINGGANFGTLENILGNLEHIGNIGQGIFGGR